MRYLIAFLFILNLGYTAERSPEAEAKAVSVTSALIEKQKDYPTYKSWVQGQNEARWEQERVEGRIEQLEVLIQALKGQSVSLPNGGYRPYYLHDIFWLNVVQRDEIEREKKNDALDFLAKAQGITYEHQQESSVDASSGLGPVMRRDQPAATRREYYLSTHGTYQIIYLSFWTGAKSRLPSDRQEKATGAAESLTVHLAELQKRQKELKEKRAEKTPFEGDRLKAVQNLYYVQEVETTDIGMNTNHHNRVQWVLTQLTTSELSPELGKALLEIARAKRLAANKLVHFSRDGGIFTEWAREMWDGALKILEPKYAKVT